MTKLTTIDSNAWALEIAASQNRNAGSLITLAQFLLVSIVGLPKRLCILNYDQHKVRKPGLARATISEFGMA